MVPVMRKFLSYFFNLNSNGTPQPVGKVLPPADFDRRNILSYFFKAKAKDGEKSGRPSSSPSSDTINQPTEVPDAVLFASDPAMREKGVRFGLARLKFDKVVSPLQKRYNAALAKLEEELNYVKTEINGTLEKRTREFDNAEKERKLDEDTLSQKEKKLEELKASVIGLDKDLRIQIDATQRQRLLDEEKTMVSEDDRLKGTYTQAQNDLKEDRDRHYKYQQEEYERQKNAWQINENVYEDRAKLLDAEKKEIDDQLTKANNRIDRLKEFGITKTTAGFLVWAGYVSLAGIGWVLARLLKNTELAQSDIFTEVVTRLASLFQLSSDANGQGTLSAFKVLESAGIFFVILLAGLLVIGCFTLFVDFILRRVFDDDWKIPKGKGKKWFRQKPTNVLQQDYQIAALFGNREIQRSSYIQLLASAPYIMVTGMLLFLLAVVAPPAKMNTQGRQNTQSVALRQSASTNSDSARTAAVINPNKSTASGGSTAANTTNTGVSRSEIPETLAWTCVGVILALLTTSACMLYAIRIVEPRTSVLFPAPNTEGLYRQELTLWKIFKANWEFAFLLVMLIVGLVLLVFQNPNPNSAGISQIQRLGLHACIIFMTLASMGLAYGLIQKGQFRDADMLRREQSFYNQVIGRLRTKPVFTPEEFVADKSHDYVINAVRNDLYGWDELRRLHRLGRMFPTRWINNKDLVLFWISRFTQPFFARPWLHNRARQVWYWFTPSSENAIVNESWKTEVVRGLEAQLGAAQSEVEQTKIDIRDLKTKIANDRPSQILANIHELRKQLAEKRAEYRQRRLRLQEQFEKNQFDFMDAYAVGYIASNFSELDELKNMDWFTSGVNGNGQENGNDGTPPIIITEAEADFSKSSKNAKSQRKKNTRRNN